MIDALDIIKRIEKRSVREAEVALWRNRRVRASFTDQVNELVDLDTLSMSIRVVIDKKIGVIGIEDLDPKKIDEYIDQVISIARVSPEDPNWRNLNQIYGKASVEGVYSKEIESISYDEILNVIKDLSQGVSEGDPLAKITRGSLTINSIEFSYTNTNMNNPMSRKENSFNIYSTVRIDTAEGSGSFSDFVSGRSIRKEFDPGSFGRELALRARDFVKTDKIETGKYTVVLENSVNASILSAVLAPAISSENIFRGRSPLTNKLGEQVLSDKIDLVDDGTAGEYVGAREFDDEGHPTQRTIVAEKGVLRNYLFDSYYANLMNTRSTGNAWRGLSSSPRPSINVLIMKSGSRGLEDLIKDISRGIYVVRVIGEWLSNPVSGYVQATITHAYEIMNGEIKRSLKGGTLTMNLYEGYGRDFVEASKEIKKMPRVVTPHVVISNVSIS